MIQGKPLTHWVTSLKSRNPDKRIEAAAYIWRAVRAKPGAAFERAIPALINGVRDPEPEVRSFCIRALTSLGPRATKATTALLAALEDREPEIACEGAQALVAIGSGKTALPGILRILAQREIYGDGFEALHKAVSELKADAKAAVPALTANLRMSEAQYRRGAAAALVSILGRDALPIFADTLKVPSAKARENVANFLGTMGKEAAGVVDELRLVLDADESGAVRAAAAHALGLIGSKSKPVLDSLGKAMRDSNRRVAIHAAGSTKMLVPGNATAFRVIKAALREKDGTLNVDAIEILSMCAGPHDDGMLPDVIRRLADKADGEEGTPGGWGAGLFSDLAVKVLVRIGPAAIPSLLSVLEGPDLQSHSAAVNALGQLGEAARVSVPLLLKVLENERAYYDEKNKRGYDRLVVAGVPGGAFEALCRLVGPENKDAVPYLVKAVTRDSESLREAGARALGRIGGQAKEALPALRGCLTDESPAVRQAAAEALRKIQR